MSTNYYLITIPELPFTVMTPLGPVEVSLEPDDPQTHVGKSYYAGEGKLGFTWCQAPNPVIAVCRTNPDREIIVNEYKDRYTGQRFLDEVVAKISTASFSLGEWFT